MPINEYHHIITAECLTGHCMAGGGSVRPGSLNRTVHIGVVKEQKLDGKFGKKSEVFHGNYGNYFGKSFQECLKNICFIFLVNNQLINYYLVTNCYLLLSR